MINQNPAYNSGLQFFGKINASISHEIRNVLAVINENSGLMKDLLIMADQGRPTDLNRIRILTEKVLDQVKRADGIVNKMNRFAHSIDKSLAYVDVVDCLSFVADLSSRFAAMKDVTLELNDSHDPVEIHSSPFLLQNIFYLCIDYAMKSAGKEKKVGIIVNKGAGAEIRFKGLEALEDTSGDWLSRGDIKDILELLEAKIEVDIAARSLLLTLPEKIGI
jgi:signal transduction histidine kinase